VESAPNVELGKSDRTPDVPYFELIYSAPRFPPRSRCSVCYSMGIDCLMVDGESGRELWVVSHAVKSEDMDPSDSYMHETWGVLD